MAVEQAKAKLRTDLLEWALGGVASILVLALFGFLAFDAITDRNLPAQIMLRAAQARAVDNKVYVEVEVENVGHAAAAEVEVEGTLRGEQASAATATLDYAPARSRKSVTLVFAMPVSLDQLNLRVLGYRDP